MSYINDKGYTSSKHNAQLRDLSSQLILHGKLVVTKNKAKDLQKYVEPLVTLAKRGDLHSRRQAKSKLLDIATKEQGKDAVVKTLFTVIAEKYKDRQGGYTKVINISSKTGDNAEMAIIAFVD